MGISIATATVIGGVQAHIAGGSFLDGALNGFANGVLFAGISAVVFAGIAGIKSVVGKKLANAAKANFVGPIQQANVVGAQKNAVMPVKDPINTTEFLSRQDAVRKGKQFLGEGFTRESPTRFVSKDGFRQMRFDFTHHGGSAPHINLETFKHSIFEIQRPMKNKIIGNHHIFFFSRRQNL